MKTRSLIVTLALLAVAACRSERASEPRPQTLETTISGGDPLYLPPGNPNPRTYEAEPVSTTTTTSADLCSGVIALRTEAEQNACDGGTPYYEKP